MTPAFSFCPYISSAGMDSPRYRLNLECCFRLTVIGEGGSIEDAIEMGESLERGSSTLGVFVLIVKFRNGFNRRERGWLDGGEMWLDGGEMWLDGEEME